MAFGILRIKKHNSINTIRRSGKHKNREQETPNADLQRTFLNTTEGAITSDELVKAVQSRVALATVKANGDDKPILAVEYLITASPEFFREKSSVEIDCYFKDVINWLKTKHGAANVVSITRHNDETSPHLSAFVVPLVERQAGTRKRSVIIGKNASGETLREIREFSKPACISLSAKHYFGETKNTLSILQSEFADKVCQKYSLERGIKGSKATHQKISRFYAQIEKPAQHVEISPESTQPKVLNKTLFSTYLETPEMVAKRLTDAVVQAYAPAVEKAKIVEFERKRAQQMILTARQAQISENQAKERVKVLEAEKRNLLKAIKENGLELEQIRLALKRKSRKI